MALGLSLPLDLIPGIGSVLSKLDNLKSDYLAIPARVNHALDALSLVQNAMVQQSAPPSEQSAALQLRTHLQSIQSEWSASAAAWQKLDSERASGSLGLDSVGTAVSLAANGAAVIANMGSIESSVTTLSKKYLNASQQQQVASVAYGLGGSGSTLLWIGGGLLALYLLRRR